MWEALEVVHVAGLVHGDISEPNIMMREPAPTDGTALCALIDFGCSRPMSKGPEAERWATCRRTLPYNDPKLA